MSTRIRSVITLVGLTLAAVPNSQGATVYIHPSSAWQISSWQYFKGVAEPPSNWRDTDFDDSSWSSGKAPFGYGLRGFVKYGTVLTDMKDGYTSVLLRKRFYVDDRARTDALKLAVNFNDGFVAWINGVQIASHNAPDRLSAASTATAARAASAEHHYAVFPVTGAQLRAGLNVLAMQWLSHGRGGDSAHLDASLVNTRNLLFGRPAVAFPAPPQRFFQPAEAVDGTQLTFWSCDRVDEQSPASLSVDLGGRHTVDRARVFWWGGELPGLGGGARDYELRVSDDGRTWRTALALKGQNGGEDELTFLPVETRHVRLHMTAANAAKGNVGLLDFEVYAAGTAPDPREFESLAIHKPATASTQPSRGSPANKAFDNNAASWWASQPGAPDPQWLAVDLEAVHRVAAVKVYFSDRFPLRFAVQLATTENEWRDVPHTVATEEIASGDNHRIHRVMFSQVQEARHARILLWGPNPHVKQYGDRYTPTEFMVIAAPASDTANAQGKP